jgi:hypothetical protein
MQNLQSNQEFSLKISDITYVNFKEKKILANDIVPYNKQELFHEGLINYERLCGRGQVVLVVNSDSPAPCRD